MVFDLTSSSISFLINVSQLSLILTDFDLIVSIEPLKLSVLSFQIFQLKLTVSVITLPFQLVFLGNGCYFELILH